MDNGFYTLNGKGDTVYFSEAFEFMDGEICEDWEPEVDPYYEERYYASYETDRNEKYDQLLFFQIISN